MNDEKQPIDISVIKGLIGDDEATIQSFFQKFVNSVPGEMDEINQAITNNDYVLTKARAHKLKSSAKAIGATDLGEICQSIEDTALQKNQSDLNQLYIDLVNEFKRCKQYIINN